MKKLRLSMMSSLLAFAMSACGMEHASLSALELQRSTLEGTVQKPAHFEKSFKAYSSLQDDFPFFSTNGFNLSGIPDEQRFNSYRPGYEQLWSTLQVRPENLSEVDWYVNTIQKNKERYASIEAKTGVPWYFVGIVHGLEGGFDFSTHLHNGDPLLARTWQVPAGRPASGSPPFSWEYSAVDALSYEGFVGWNSWNDPAVLAYAFEGYNGLGYRQHGINSPYLWSYTTAYSKGKYVADGRFDPYAVSQQAGAMAILKRGLDRGLFSLGKPAPSQTNVAADSQPALVRELEEGANGKDVQLLQMRLADYGTYMGSFTGVFDTATVAAVVQFQNAVALTPDGVVGKITWQKLWPALSDVSWMKGFKVSDSIRLAGMQAGRCLLKAESKDARVLTLFMKASSSAQTLKYGGMGAAQNLPNACPDFRNVYDLTAGKIVLTDKVLPAPANAASTVTWHRLVRGAQDAWKIDSFAGSNAVTALESSLKSDVVSYFEKHSKAIDILSDGK